MMQDKKRPKKNEYRNYKLPRSSNNFIDTIQLKDPKVTKEWFFETYIRPRKPVLIKTLNTDKVRIDIDNFRPGRILETLQGEQNKEESEQLHYLQVEELNQGGFGTGQKRLKLKLDQFLDRINKGESLYLTTQYSENHADPLSETASPITDGPGDEAEGPDDEEEDEDEDEDEEGEDIGGAFPALNGNLSDDDEIVDLHDDFDDVFDDVSDDDDHPDDDIGEPVDPIYQPPLSNLLNGKLEKLPPHPFELTESLVPQQINMWFGRTPEESTLLDIIESEQGSNIASINRGLPTPNSTSTGLHHDHADNIYVLAQGKKRFTLYSPDYAPDLYTVGDVRYIYDTGVIDYFRNEKAKNWSSIRADGGCIESCSNTVQSTETEEKVDPPSFSRIPPALLHLDQVDEETRKKLEKYTKDNFPLFYPVRNSSVKVTLEEGDLLYLPAGWFHEVTSFGDEDKNNVHVAVNYWFVPPDGSTSEQPYSDKVWEENFEMWKKKFL